MARCSPTPTSAALIPSNTTQGAWEPARGCSSSAVPPPAPRTAHPQQHRLPSVLSTHSELVNKANFRMKCPCFGCFVLGFFFLSMGAGLLRSRAWAQADGGTGPNWECAADSASTAALIYLHCSAPPPPFPFSFPYLPPPALALSSPPHSYTAILEHGSEISWGRIDIKWGAGPYIVYMCRWKLSERHIWKYTKSSEMEEGRGRREMLRVHMTWGRGKEPKRQNFAMWQKRKWMRDRKGGCSI